MDSSRASVYQKLATLYAEHMKSAVRSDSTALSIDTQNGPPVDYADARRKCELLMGIGKL
jgi:hypothetical protein